MSCDEIHRWFGLGRASFLVLPRVLLQEMPDAWQERFVALLEEYEAAFPNQPKIGTQVRATSLRGRLVPMPRWLMEYRRPDMAEIARARKGGG